ncbi:MAG: hypothetical protein U5J62_05560 [Desulfurivibrio sp.]|nr:hypothetical protein [Desulfurivibrio sp.]
MASIIARTSGVRVSRRYPGYLRVGQREYRLALLARIREDAADLLEAYRLAPLLSDLERRLLEPESCGAGGRLVRE